MLPVFAFPAGGRQIDAKGNFFRYEYVTTTGGVDDSIRLKVDGADLGLLWPGDELKFDDGLTGKRWEITPTSGATVGVVRVGLGRVGSSKVAGTVRVLDQGVDKTLAGLQMLASVTRAAGGAGVFSIAGIRALTYRTAIKRIQVSSTIAGLVSLFACTGDPTVNPNNTAAAGVNKILRDGASSSAKALRGDAAAVTPTGVELPGVFGLVSIYVAANTYAGIPLTTPLVLNVGNGVVAVPQTANRDVTLLIDWEDSTP